MLLKGAALIPLNYRDLGLRPMSDFDLLVPLEQVLPVVETLLKSGWSPISESCFPLTVRNLSVFHSYSFRDCDKRRFDLHWHLLSEIRDKDTERLFWDGAVKTHLHNLPTLALNPTDQLLHVCAHGAKWNSVPPLRWVADAMMVLKTSRSDMDWGRLADLAVAFGQVPPLQRSLGFLQEVMGAEIPSSILLNLQAIPVSRAEQIEYEIWTLPPGRIGPWRRNWMHFRRHSRISSGSTRFQRIL